MADEELWIGAGLLLLLASSSSSAAPSSGGGGGGGGTVTPPPTDGKAELERVLAKLPSSIDPAWHSFLRIKAYQATRNNPRAYYGIAEGAPPWGERNDSAAEAMQAGIMFDRNAKLFASSGFSRERYSFGAAGLGDMMPTNGLFAFRGTPDINADPWIVFEVPASVAMSLAFAYRLQQHAAFARDRLFTRIFAGCASLRRMSDDAWIAGRKPLWQASSIAAGEPSTILDQEAPELPELNWSELWRSLR